MLWLIRHPGLVHLSYKLACQSELLPAGNVATEDVVYLLNGLGIQHGVNMDKLLDANEFILGALGRSNSSRAAKALLAARKQRVTQ